jgi:hypothetical protein
MLQDEMVPDCTRAEGASHGLIVIDDYRRLPGRFFGRFTASITAGLR